MTRTKEAWVLFLATRLFGIAVDAAVVALAYFTAFALRLDFNEPAFGWRATGLSCVNVCIVHFISLLVCGCYALSWRRICLREVPRYAGAMALAAAVLTAMRIFLPGVGFAHVRPPYSITPMCFVLASVGIIGVRYMWRVFWNGRQRDSGLIARDECHFDNAAAARFLVGKTVMVTGAGGTIGSEIVRQAAAAGAASVLLVERCENALYEIDREMRARANCSVRFLPLMVDAGDRDRMEKIFAAEKPDVVLHAAAYKHVPMVELNPEEGWRNNTETTRTLAGLSAEYGVKRFVLISTDKAVNPVSVMGRTKRAAEEAVMRIGRETAEKAAAAGGAEKAEAASFCAVRFGNVFGSSGSVVPLFREQIARKGPVTVTHPEMRRYFMTVQEAVALVLQAASRREQAIYTLDMGESVRILDLAEGMIVQAGYRPYVDIPIVFTGVRPGEKLFEELDVSEKSCYRTDMAKIYITKT